MSLFFSGDGPLILDLLAKRYKRLPTEVLPPGTIPKGFELSFNYNVAMLGLIAEHKNQILSNGTNHAVNNRQQALAAIAKAKAGIADIEEERKRLRIKGNG